MVEPTAITPFSKGVNQIARETAMPENTLREAVNVDITNDGGVRRRAGAAKLVSASGAHSLTEVNGLLLLVADEHVCLLNPSVGSLTQLAPLTQPTRRMSFAFTGHEVAFSNGADSGRLVGASLAYLPLSVPTPGAPTLVEALSGILPGQYTAVLVYAMPDGQLSAASRPARITTSGGGLEVSWGATPAGYPASTQIYLTPPGGTILYRAAVAPYGVTSWRFSSDPVLSEEISTLHLAPLPLGELAFFAGRLYSFVGNTLYASQSLRYGLYRPDADFLRFPAEIKLVAPVEEGIYVVADHTYFLAGKEFEKFSQRMVYPYSGVSGSALTVKASQFSFKEPITGDAAVWFSDRGLVMGAPSGQVIPLSEGVIDPGQWGLGSTFVSERDGVRQVGSVLTNQGKDSALRVSDSVTAVVRRNGVIVD